MGLRFWLMIFAVWVIPSPAHACMFSERPRTAEEIAATEARDRQERENAEVITAIVIGRMVVPSAKWQSDFITNPPRTMDSFITLVRYGYSYYWGGGECSHLRYYQPNLFDYALLNSGILLPEATDGAQVEQFPLNEITGYFVTRTDQERPAQTYFVVLSLLPCKKAPTRHGRCSA